MIDTKRNKKIVMIAVDIDTVAAFRWNESLGEKLRNMREELGYSRKTLSTKTEEFGKKVSEAYIQQLESPQSYIGRSGKSGSLTVSSDIVHLLCDAMKIEITELIRSTKVFL